MASLLFVCHGNVCRSTMAQFVFDHLVRERGVQERFSADSAATSREEIGKDVHRGTRRKLAEMGLPEELTMEAVDAMADRFSIYVNEIGEGTLPLSRGRGK